MRPGWVACGWIHEDGVVCEHCQGIGEVPSDELACVVADAVFTVIYDGITSAAVIEGRAALLTARKYEESYE